MNDEIINRVAQSALITFNLEDYYPNGERIQLDISQWLYEGIILKEKEFRASIEAHNWEAYQDAYVAIHCSTDAIVPGWANLLVSAALAPFAKKAVVGNLNILETIIFSEIINNLNVQPFIDRTVIIKGCTNKPIPENAYISLCNKLHGVAKRIMYGEACSSVPIYKR